MISNEELSKFLEDKSIEQLSAIFDKTALNEMGEKLATLDAKVSNLETKEASKSEEPEVDHFSEYLKDTGLVK